MKYVCLIIFVFIKLYKFNYFLMLKDEILRAELLYHYLYLPGCGFYLDFYCLFFELISLKLSEQSIRFQNYYTSPTNPW